MGNKITYTDDMLKEAVENSKSFSGVGRYLGYTAVRGGAFERIKNKCKILRIDTTHFTGQSFKGELNPAIRNRKKSDEILVKGLTQREAHKRLKRALLEKGIVYRCSMCNIYEWNNKPITLDIDHIDGDWSNCDISNLRFLCPNCHRQTDTYAGKNIGKLSKSGDIA